MNEKIRPMIHIEISKSLEAGTVGYERYFEAKQVMIRLYTFITRLSLCRREISRDEFIGKWQRSMEKIEE